MRNLVCIALTVVKTKSAATHYETIVASHSFAGSDVGEVGHSGKQFSAILCAAEVWATSKLQNSYHLLCLQPNFTPLLCHMCQFDT